MAFSRLLSGSSGPMLLSSSSRADFIDTWKAELESSGAPDRIFGNLPYSAANAIIASLLEASLVPSRMIFTVQKEAGLRMIAVPGTKDYSSLLSTLHFACKMKLAFDWARAPFGPCPRHERSGAHAAEAGPRRGR